MPAALVGYDLGAAVATGFAAKYPSYCASLSLLAPIGFKYKKLPYEKILRKPYIGNYYTVYIYILYIYLIYIIYIHIYI